MPLSHSQLVALAILPKVTGLLSVCFSSASIIYILKSNGGRNKFFHQLILAMGFADIVSSLSYSMSTWATPKDSGALYAVGNEATCQTQGFFIQFGVASPFYNCALGFFYLLAINYGWNDAAFRKWGVVFHGIPILFAFGTSIAAIVMDLFHFANLWCWIGPNPDGEGRLGYSFYRMALFYGPIWASFFLVTICLSLVFAHVRNITLKAEANLHNWRRNQALTRADSSPDLKGFVEKDDDELYHDQGFDDDDEPKEDETTPHCSSTDDSEMQIDKAVEKKNVEIFMYTKRRKQIAHQCLRYSVGFYVTWIPITCLRIMQLMEKPAPYALLLAAAGMAPLQGLPNFVTLVFPRMRKILRERKKQLKPAERKLSPYDAAVSKSSARPKPKLQTQDEVIARSIVNSFKGRMGYSNSSSTNQQQQQQQQQQQGDNAAADDDTLSASNAEDEHQSGSNYIRPEMYMMMASRQK